MAFLVYEEELLSEIKSSGLSKLHTIASEERLWEKFNIPVYNRIMDTSIPDIETFLDVLEKIEKRDADFKARAPGRFVPALIKKVIYELEVEFEEADSKKQIRGAAILTKLNLPLLEEKYFNLLQFFPYVLNHIGKATRKAEEHKVEKLSSAFQLLYDVAPLINCVKRMFWKYSLGGPTQLLPREVLTDRDVAPEQDDTKFSKLWQSLKENNFFTLEKTKSLSSDQNRALVRKLTDGNLPYKIAMLEHVGFIRFIERQHPNSTKIDYCKHLKKAIGNNANDIENAINGLLGGQKPRYDSKRFEDLARDDFADIIKVHQ